MNNFVSRCTAIKCNTQFVFHREKSSGLCLANAKKSTRTHQSERKNCVARALNVTFARRALRCDSGEASNSLCIQIHKE